MNLPFLPKIFPRDPAQRQAELERQLIHQEAEIGGKIFGPLQKGHTRQFFCLDEHTWIWHEEWIEKGQRKVVNTRYEVRPNGVIKVQNGRSSQLTAAEAQHLYKAVDIYQQKVDAHYQMLLQSA